MNFINMGLFQANIDVNTLPSGKNKAMLNIDTNGYARIGSYRIPDDGYGSRKLDIRNGIHSVYEDVDPFTHAVFCKKNENKVRFTTNPKDQVFTDKAGRKALYLIAVPFRKRIAQIIPSEGVTIFKACFTSCRQSTSKNPYVWAAEKTTKSNLRKFEYGKTLYIVAEADITKANNANFNIGETVGSIRVIESGMDSNEAKGIIEVTAVEASINTEITLHDIEIPLIYNSDDSFPDGGVAVTNHNFYPHEIPVGRINLENDKAVEMANRVLGTIPLF